MALASFDAPCTGGVKHCLLGRSAFDLKKLDSLQAGGLELACLFKQVGVALAADDSHDSFPCSEKDNGSGEREGQSTAAQMAPHRVHTNQPQPSHRGTCPRRSDMRERMLCHATQVHAVRQMSRETRRRLSTISPSLGILNSLATEELAYLGLIFLARISLALC